MLEFPWKKKETEFDDAIERVLETMNAEEVGSQEYKNAIVYLDRLVAMRQKDTPNRVTRDTIWIVGGGLLQVVLIVFAEQNHVIVSKALSFIMKPKNGSITI